MGKALKKNRAVIVFIGALIGCVLVLSRLLYDSYGNFSRNIVTQQQEHLLSISSTVSNNLSLYISGELEKLEVLTESYGFQAEYQKYYGGRRLDGLTRYIRGYMYKQGMSRVYIMDKDLNIILKHDPKPLPERFEDGFLLAEPLVLEAGSGVGEAFKISGHHMAVPVVHSIYIDGRYMGAVVGVVDLQNVYNEVVAPVSVGRTGFVTAADRHGTVLMHPAEERVGTNYFANPYLKEGYFDEQQAMRREQYSSISGIGKFKTVWWLSPYAPKAVALIGYSRVQTGENFWVVSAMMDYEEAMEISDDNVPKMTAFAVALFVLFAIGVATFWWMYRNRQELIQEAKNLKALNSALEDLNKSREQVMHYQKLQTIGNFANGIAHEFNNLLTPILGLSALLKEDLKDRPQALEDIETIHQSGMKARELILQILTFGRKKPDKESFSVLRADVLLQDALGILKAILPPSISLVTDFNHGDACCLGNRSQLNQVALNLCSNAYQSMEKEGGVLTLTTRRVEGGLIEFTISDTGCGIEPEYLEQIFDPYFTTKDIGKGTGIGLAVVRGIVEGHDGYIDAQSVPGEGSSFHVYLPEASPMFMPSEYAETEKRGRPSSVMLIDDAEDVAHTMSRLLNKAGYRVQAHTDARRALDAFERNFRGYDLIITDYAMQELNGREVAERVKALRRDIPIILMTGYTDSEVGGVGQIFAGVLHKPLDFGLLCGVVEKTLGEAKKTRKQRQMER